MIRVHVFVEGQTEEGKVGYLEDAFFKDIDQKHFIPNLLMKEFWTGENIKNIIKYHIEYNNTSFSFKRG